jgi:spore germination protein GerM
MKRYSRSRRSKGILIVAFIIFAAIVGALLLKKYDTSSRRPQVPPPAAQTGTVLVTLFFASHDGDALVREGREIDASAELDESVQAVLEELISGPVGDYAPVLPYNTQIRGVQVQGDLALVDFGKELVAAMPAGSSAEMAAVYSVVDSIAANFPQIKKVQITIDGEHVSTLKGHLDLRGPLVPDYTLEKRP